MTIKVAIADSQYLIRVGLRHLIGGQPEFELLWEASRKEQLFHLLNQNPPDVLIFDYNKPKSFDQEDLKRIRKDFPWVGVLIISADDSRENIYQVLEEGVNSFLTKECDQTEIFSAIKATAAKEKFFCSKVLDYLIQKSFHRPETCAPTPLSPREIEIVQLVAEGKTAKDISEELFISPHTIYTHRKNIMRKLKLGSSSELILYAVRQGWVNSDLV